MKADIHPKEYRTIIFHDNSSGERFLVGSTIHTTDTAKWSDGKEYPLTNVDVSSASHPFYTGQEKIMDTAGRVERFKTRASKKTTITRTKKKA
jgi:large subunit ribosomal protein L31